MKHPFVVAAVFATLWCSPGSAEKQTYAMSLGNRQIGTLVFDWTDRNARLLSVMNNTPMGVANGSFEAVTQVKGGAVTYLGTSRGSKTRDISVTRQAARVTAVTVTPVHEATKMTVPAAVPLGVVSPTEGFAVLARGKSCPGPVMMYDGRRVIQMATQTQALDGNEVTCAMSYRVIKGPGHLSPFRFKSIGMQVVYTAQTLTRITMSAGGFDVNLVRQK